MKSLLMLALISMVLLTFTANIVYLATMFDSASRPKEIHDEKIVRLFRPHLHRRVHRRTGIVSKTYQRDTSYIEIHEFHYTQP